MEPKLVVYWTDGEGEDKEIVASATPEDYAEAREIVADEPDNTMIAVEGNDGYIYLKGEEELICLVQMADGNLDWGSEAIVEEVPSKYKDQFCEIVNLLGYEKEEAENVINKQIEWYDD